MFISLPAGSVFGLESYSFHLSFSGDSINEGPFSEHEREREQSPFRFIPRGRVYLTM